MFPDGVTKNEVSPETVWITTLGVLAGVLCGGVVSSGAMATVPLGVWLPPAAGAPVPALVVPQPASVNSSVPASTASVRGRDTDMPASLRMTDLLHGRRSRKRGGSRN